MGCAGHTSYMDHGPCLTTPKFRLEAASGIIQEACGVHIGWLLNCALDLNESGRVTRVALGQHARTRAEAVRV